MRNKKPKITKTRAKTIVKPKKIKANKKTSIISKKKNKSSKKTTNSKIKNSPPPPSSISKKITFYKVFNMIFSSILCFLIIFSLYFQTRNYDQQLKGVVKTTISIDNKENEIVNFSIFETIKKRKAQKV